LVEQGAQLFPHLTVEENIRYGIQAQKSDTFVDGWIERFGLTPYLASRPNQLSGGLVQRAIIARAIAGRPEVLLLDEPFSALDWTLQRVLQDAISDLRQELGTTVIIVTHQLSEAQRMADKIGIIQNGKILQEGTPQSLMMKPASWEIARLLGYTHLLEDNRGSKFSLHPSRIVLGDKPHLGPVLRGEVVKQFLCEGEQHILLALESFGHQMVELTIPTEVEINPGKTLTFTVPNPPYLD